MGPSHHIYPRIAGYMGLARPPRFLVWSICRPSHSGPDSQHRDTKKPPGASTGSTKAQGSRRRDTVATQVMGLARPARSLVGQSVGPAISDPIANIGIPENLRVAFRRHGRSPALASP